MQKEEKLLILSLLRSIHTTLFCLAFAMFLYKPSHALYHVLATAFLFLLFNIHKFIVISLDFILV